MKKAITNSELQTFKDCRRRWYLAWHRRLRPISQKKVGAAPLGSRVHEALESLYKGMNPLATLEASRERDAAALDGDLEALHQLDAEHQLALIMVEGYIEWLAETGEDEGLEVVGLEAKVEVPFTGITGATAAGWTEVTLMGKLDQRVRRQVDGAVLFLDHKTVGSIPQAIKFLHMDEQMLHYHLLEMLAALDRDDSPGIAQGALYNMLRKVKRTARANPPFYGRHLVTHTTVELRNYWMRVVGETEDIARATAQLNAGVDHRAVAYPRPTKDCEWKCEFFAVCPLFDDGSAAETMLEMAYREENPLDRYEMEDAHDA